MRIIELTQGAVALIDDEDYERVSNYNWCLQKTRRHSLRYAARATPRSKPVDYHVLMHRFILDAPKGMHIHHVNGNGLDNRRFNLQIVSPTHHSQLPRPHGSSVSGYRGVTLHKAHKKWQTSLRHLGKDLHCGYYDCPIDAAKARDAKARQLSWPEEGMNFPVK